MNKNLCFAIVGILAAGAILLAPSPAVAGKGAAREAVEQRAAAWGDACNRGDTSTLGELYTEDAQLHPPNAAPVKGRAAIASFFGHLCDGKMQGDLQTLELDVRGNLAYRVGSYTLRSGGTMVDQGKFIEIWGRTGRVWHIRHDIYNSSLAP